MFSQQANTFISKCCIFNYIHKSNLFPFMSYNFSLLCHYKKIVNYIGFSNEIRTKIYRKINFLRTFIQSPGKSSCNLPFFVVCIDDDSILN